MDDAAGTDGDDGPDAQMRAFVAQTTALYPEDAASRSVAQQRAIYDRMAAAFRAPRPAGVFVRDDILPGGQPVPLRRYEPATPGPAVVLYLHGGGFVVGGLDSHDDVCAEICAHTGFAVVSADYRLAPEHPHPAAFEDGLAVARHLCAGDLPVVLAGDSAGANLAAAACHALRAEGLHPAGQVLIYAGLGGSHDLPSRRIHAQAPMLTLADVMFYDTVRGPARPDDPTVAPLRDRDFSGLPPTVLVPAEIDPLHDDSPAYAQAIRDAGGRAVSLTQAGWLHGGLRARHQAAVAARAFDVIVDAIATLGRGGWDWD